MNPSETQDEFQQGHEAPPPGTKFMSVLRWVLVVGMAVVAVYAVARYARRSGDASTITQSPNQEQRYQCPMHPQIIRPQPGACPICGMDLVLIEEAEHKHTDDDASVKGLVAIDLPLDRVQKIGVKTAKVALMDVPSQVRTVGLLEANERGRVAVVARFSGFVEALYVNETGQQVKKGQPIAKIYSPEVLQAQEEFINAQQWNAPTALSASNPTHPGHAEASTDLLKDARRRLELLGLAAQDIDDIAARKQAQAAVILRAPSSGYVTSKTVLAGAAIERGAQLLEIADLSVLWLVADIYEGDLARVRLGNKAQFTTAAFPGESFAAKVQFVYPTVDASARTLRVRLELRNPTSAGGVKLRPGMYGDVFIETAAGKALMVLAEAVVDTGQAQYIFVAQGEGRFTPRPVKLGARRGEFVEVLQGLVADQEVVTTANFLIDSESRLQSALRGQQ